MAIIDKLLAGKTVKFKKTKHGYIAERTLQAMFNGLHRHHNIKSLKISKVTDSTVSIVAVTHDGEIVINGKGELV